MGIEGMEGLVPSSASSVHRWKYDVFVSFRGGDIRLNFAAHLFRALKQSGIYYFCDNDKEESGILIEPKLLEAIRHSRVSLVVFTTNYADSRWCLNELAEILECNRRFRDRHGHVVLPIFYDVEPRDVRKQTGRFGDGFGRCLAAHTDDLLVQKWRDSLSEAGNISGWRLKYDANGNQSDFIEKIVEHLLKIIPRTSSPHAIGVDSFVDDVISLLKIGSEDHVRVVGIWGIKGIGKTTVAKAVYPRIFREFEGVSFLENVGVADQGTILLLQKRLLHDLLQVQGLDIYDFNSNVNDIKNILRRKRILLILDGITKKDQIEYFGVGDREWLQYGSRILITTREEQLLEDLNVDDKYMLPELGSKESLQLMSRHACGKDQPKEGYEELFKSLVHYAGGLPMVLKRFGSFLSRRKNQWNEILEKLVKDPYLDSIEISHPSVGPFGGDGGDSFDDQTFGDIRKITVIILRGVVESITCDYDQNGCLVQSARHGGFLGGHYFHWEVSLDYPVEYLTSVSGYISEDSDHVINSLTFHSNKHAHGPVGAQKGKFFRFPEVDGKIIGFHGRCGRFLDSIGAYFGPVSRPYPFEVVGPFGNGQNRWDDGKRTVVRQIVVVSGSAIESISFTYEDGRSLRHGTSDGGNTDTINLDWLTEYLTSVSGYIANDLGSTIIHSLTFQSNKRTYGPFGTETGRKFSFPATGGKIIGFYGSSRSHLESLGAYFEPISHLYPIKCLGPFGGQGGDSWDDGKFNGVKKIKIMLENVVNCISFEYDACGESIWSSTHGHSGNGDICVVNLDYPREFLISVSGYIRPDYPAIQSLTFESNIRRHGPFGQEEGRFFRCALTCSKIIGFHGRSSVLLDALGVYTEPVSDLRFVKSIGPFGGQGGIPWDDGDSTGVRGIIVKTGLVFDAITFVYDKNGSVVRSTKHGGDGGAEREIKLDYPREYLTSFSGYYGEFGGYTVVHSLTFQSNERTLGPFGLENGKYFFFPSTGKKIVGFHGRSHMWLDSLGAHFEP